MAPAVPPSRRAHRRQTGAVACSRATAPIFFCEEEVEMNELTGLMIGIAPVLTALAWCNLRDRRIDLANKVRAHMSATVNRVLGGESLVAVRVEPALVRRPGRVHLSAPSAYAGLM